MSVKACLVFLLQTGTKQQNRKPLRRRVPTWALIRAELSRKGRFAVVAKAIVGEKLGMTQVWDDEDCVVPVTVLKG